MEQPRQIIRIVGEVRVHFAHHLGAVLDRPPKAGGIGGAETLLRAAMQDMYPSVARQLVGDIARSVGRVVVDNQKLRALLGDACCDPLEILSLVVGGQHHEDVVSPHLLAHDGTTEGRVLVVKLHLGAIGLWTPVLESCAESAGNRSAGAVAAVLAPLVGELR